VSFSRVRAPKKARKKKEEKCKNYGSTSKVCVFAEKVGNSKLWSLVLSTSKDRRNEGKNEGEAVNQNA